VLRVAQPPASKLHIGISKIMFPCHTAVTHSLHQKLKMQEKCIVHVCDRVMDVYHELKCNSVEDKSKCNDLSALTTYLVHSQQNTTTVGSPNETADEDE
jgi:hypothetical protein